MSDKPGDEAESQRLRQTVTNLLVRIEENQQIQARFHDFEFQLLSCISLEELLAKILRGAQSHFQLAAVSLVLHDPDYKISTLMEYLDLDDFGPCLQLRHSDEFFIDLYQHSPTVRLGQQDVLTTSRLFPGCDTGVGSVALLPLMRQHSQIGSLHFGAEDPNRYSADKAVSFMWHLASMMAICIENSVAFEHFQRLGKEDNLTRVHNRRSFEEEFVKEIERAQRQQQALSLLFIDVDHFKGINDSYGHQVGDQCLRHIAKQIKGELRKTDLPARYGGEEFVIILPNTEITEAELIAERVRLAVANAPLEHEIGHLPLTVSIGLTCWRGVGGEMDNEVQAQLISESDAAMYLAKQRGRNQVVSYHPDTIAASLG